MRIQMGLQRILSAFTAAPGLRVTAVQGQRMWGLDGQTCQALLDALADARFLARAADGSFVCRSGTLPGLTPRVEVLAS